MHRYCIAARLWATIKGGLHLRDLEVGMVIEKQAKFGTWKYYVNDEGKARWKCSVCGKIIRHGVHEKLYCSNCGSKMKMEA